MSGIHVTPDVPANTSSAPATQSSIRTDQVTAVAQPVIEATVRATPPSSVTAEHTISTTAPNASQSKQVELLRCFQTGKYYAFHSYSNEELSKFFYSLTPQEVQDLYNSPAIAANTDVGIRLLVVATIHSIKSGGTCADHVIINRIKAWKYYSFTSKDYEEITKLLRSSQHEFIKKIVAFFGSASLPLTPDNFPLFKEAIESAVCADMLIRNLDPGSITYEMCRNMCSREISDTSWPIIKQILTASRHPLMCELRGFIQRAQNQEITRHQFLEALSAWEGYKSKEPSFYFDLEQFTALLQFPVPISVVMPILRAMEGNSTNPDWISFLIRKLQAERQLTCDVVRARLQEVKAFIEECASLDTKTERERVEWLQTISPKVVSMIGANTASPLGIKIKNAIKALYTSYPELIAVIQALPQAQQAFFQEELLCSAVANRHLTLEDQLTRILALDHPPDDEAIATALQASTNPVLRRMSAWYVFLHEVLPDTSLKILLSSVEQQAHDENGQPPQKEMFMRFCDAVPGKENPVTAANISEALRGIKIFEDVNAKRQCAEEDMRFLSSFQFSTTWKEKVDRAIQELKFSQMEDVNAIVYLYKKPAEQRIKAIAACIQVLPHERVKNILCWVSLCDKIDTGSISIETLEDIFEQERIDENIMQIALPDISHERIHALAAMKKADYCSLRNQLYFAEPTNCAWKKAIQERVAQLRKINAEKANEELLQEAFSNRVLLMHIQKGGEENNGVANLLQLSTKNFSEKENAELVAAIKKRGREDPVQKKIAERCRQLAASEEITAAIESQALLHVIEVYYCQNSENADLSTVRSVLQKNISSNERAELLKALFVDDPETPLKTKCRIRLQQLMQNGSCQDNAEGHQKALDQLLKIYYGPLSFDDIAVLAKQNLTDEEEELLRATIQRRSPEPVLQVLQELLIDGNSRQLYAAIAFYSTQRVTALLRETRITLQDLYYLPAQTMSDEQKAALWAKLEEQNNATTPKDVEIDALITFGNAHGKQISAAIEYARTYIVTTLLAKETVTLQDMQQVLGHAITKTHAEALVEKLRTQLRTSAQRDEEVQAFIVFYDDLKKNWWDHLETKKASAAVLLPEALYIYNHLKRAEPTQQVAASIVTKKSAHLPRMGVVHDAAMTIFARRKLSVINPALGGAFKVPFAALTIQKTSQGLKIRPTIRLRADTNEFLQKNIDVVRQLGSAEEFGGFHALITYDNKSQTPECSAIWDRATGDLEQVATTPKQQLSIFTDISAAVLKLHKQGKTHRDIKPKNMLCVLNSAGDARGKLIDFDLTDDYSATSIDSYGTLGYWAPELVQNRHTDKPLAADMFALGTAMYQVVFGREAPWCAYSMNGQYDAMVEQITQYCTHNNDIVVAVERSTDTPLTEKEILIYLSIQLLAIDPTRRCIASQLNEKINALKSRI